MRYKSFRIRNFKGIKDTTINLQGIGGAGVFAFVGLNESGKTTVLEAIHSFSPDRETSELLGGEEGLGVPGVPFNDRVPRHLISMFTSDVSVTAILSTTKDDKARIARAIKARHSLDLKVDDFPDEIVFERHQRFERGDFKQSFFSLRTLLKIKGPKQRLWRDPTGEERVVLRDVIYGFTPDIAYFPTFVFDFPETIFLTRRGSLVDRFYRQVFQDILDYDGQGHTIQKDIVGRVRAKPLVVPWLQFLASWLQHEDRPKIQHVMDRAGAAVTRLVFGRWNEIFGEDTRGKEVIITYETVQGEKVDDKGVRTPTEEHDVYAKFQIRDGTRRFNVNDRSLGFRWFFAFMLFTQFRVARSRSRPVLFLFDEPASNLHAAAQQKLIDCFPGIARGEHTLAYSTHSHYMVEPEWLEQTFIVTNRADAPVSSVLDAVSLDDESLDIKVTSYRSFVNEHPSQISYFQPILDRLQVVPSRFDMREASVVLEGKSDYYILRYAAKATKLVDLPLLPASGAGTFGSLAALHAGWNLNFLFVLDGDRQGKTERERYISDYGIPPNRIVTIDRLVPGVRMIEDLLDDRALERIKAELGLGTRPDKSQIRRFFQERLASDTITDLGKGFTDKATAFLEGLRERLI